MGGVAIVGAGIWQQTGYQKVAKTVVTGVAYDAHGRPVKVPDPRLEHRSGVYVPFMHHDEAYKHLGLWRRADGVD